MDNTAVSPSGDSIRDIDRQAGGVKTPVTQIDFGGDNTHAERLATESDPFPVKVAALDILRQLLNAVRSLGIVTAITNRLNVDVNNVVGGTLIVTQGTATNLNANVGTVGTVTTLNQLAGVTAYTLLMEINRAGYNGGIRTRL